MRKLIVGILVFIIAVFSIGYNAGKGNTPPPEVKIVKVPEVKVKTKVETVYEKADLPAECIKAFDAAKEIYRNASTAYNSLAKTEAQLKGAREDAILLVPITERLESIRAVESENNEAMMALAEADLRFTENRTDCEEKIK